mgnify:CR=1 FL=1
MGGGVIIVLTIFAIFLVYMVFMGYIMCKEREEIIIQ